MSKIMLVYEQVLNDFIVRMKTGELKVGDRLPSENDCAERYQISRSTVRKVYSRLSESGFIVKKAGSGSYLSEDVEKVMASYTKPKDNEDRRKIALLVSSDILFNKEIIDSVRSRLRLYDRELVVVDNNDDVVKEHKNLRDIAYDYERTYGGLIVVPVKCKDELRGEFYGSIAKLDVPITIIGKPPHAMLADAVYVDDGVTVYEIVRRLYKEKCERVIILYEGNEGHLIYSDRLRAYYVAMNRFYFNAKELVIDCLSDSWELQLEMLFDNVTGKTGVILFNPKCIVPLTEILKKRGLKFKEDVRVIAYGAERSYNFTDVKLSVMSIPKKKLGEKAVELLMENVNGTKKEYGMNYIFPAQYVDGDT